MGPPRENSSTSSCLSLYPATVIPPGTEHIFQVDHEVREGSDLKLGVFFPRRLEGTLILPNEGVKPIALTCFGLAREKGTNLWWQARPECGPCGVVAYNTSWYIQEHKDGSWHFKRGLDPENERKGPAELNNEEEEED